MMEILIPNRVLTWESLTLNQRFILAAYRGNTQIINEVLKFSSEDGFDPNCYDKYGFTALHAASARGYFDIVKALLLDHRVSLSILDKLGRHPIEIAWKSGFRNIVALIYKSLYLPLDNKFSNIQVENFLKILFHSSDDIMGNLCDLSKLQADKANIDIFAQYASLI